MLPGKKTPVERPKKNVRGKKKRHTLKSQVVVDKATKEVISIAFDNGKKHDFRLFKESTVLWTEKT